ncbi:30S ribosomal protein S8 [Nitrosomonas ureae]|uniref:Small ribosomal subunit protein uS8 n=1 Tax=Nitrosomonas ureae TaxID=44577 RepID=A0A0S3AJR2_9PROT|nr:30S ribosomal protein S8 [Nitrosomonas ureae]ALQ51275.1 30S ribosomal protein S8 [Nitrosomonas ureae]PTQ83868.1 SSU ribosomal protein S8P [Nitrosomonas ureae]PXX15478.1 SSU ribosomal protein S8P [Nitrosomonas ureae]SDU24948.1 SSU ribosomal protein S8P [Nitrosomonas ureae]SEQ14400.1 small subunit ribosomal protein S8 [Nitrosomonas ureae]
MSMSDPIADMLTRIRNAQLAKKKSVIMPNSRIKKAIAMVLKDEGYIENFNIFEEGIKTNLEVELKYYSGASVIEKISRVSKPGLRIYKSSKNLPNVMNGLGVAIMSTSKGVMTQRKAQMLRVGGELLCYVV